MSGKGQWFNWRGSGRGQRYCGSGHRSSAWMTLKNGFFTVFVVTVLIALIIAPVTAANMEIPAKGLALGSCAIGDPFEKVVRQVGIMQYIHSYRNALNGKIYDVFTTDKGMVLSFVKESLKEIDTTERNSATPSGLKVGDPLLKLMSLYGIYHFATVTRNDKQHYAWDHQQKRYLEITVNEDERVERIRVVETVGE